MQERVLGSLIMGGIALIGIVWGCIEGIAPLSDAKKDEAVLETSLKETIKDFNTDNLSNFDCKMAKYSTLSTGSSKRPKVVMFIDMYGYTDDNKTFVIGVQTTNDYILTLSEKLIAMLGPEATKEDLDREKELDANRMNSDVYQNHTMVTSKELNKVLADENTKVYKYAIDNDTKYRVDYSVEDGKIVEKIVVDVRQK